MPDRGRRVVIVTETFLPRVDGITNTLCHTLEHLPGLGWDVLLVSSGVGPDHYRGVPVLRVPSRPLPLYPEVQLGIFPPSVAARVEAFAPDLVQLAGPAFLGLGGLWFARRHGIPVLAVYHTHLARYARFYGLGPAEALAWAALRTVHNRAAVTLAPAGPVAEELRAHGIRDVAVWSRGVDTTLFHPERASAAVRAELGAGEGDVLALYVGRVAKEKGLAHLPAILDAQPRLKLAIVGDGPYRAELQALLPPDRVVFTGYRRGTELAACYASADLFLFPSATETFGNVVLEAMASGLPVVALDAGGVPDIVSPETGVLARSGSGLGAALGPLLADPGPRYRLGAAGRAEAERRSWPAIVAELAAWYDRVLAGGRASGVRPGTAASPAVPGPSPSGDRPPPG